MVYPVRKFPNKNTIYDVGRDTNTTREWNQDNTRKSSVPSKDSEAQWQDVSQEKPVLTKQSHHKVCLVVIWVLLSASHFFSSSLVRN